MIVDNYVSVPGIKANGTVVQYRALKMHTSANQVTAITNANAERPVGILQNDPATGEAADVAVLGVCKGEYGGNVSVGDSLSIDNSGKLITDAVVLAQDSVDLYHIGLALESGADTEVHYVLVYPAQPIGKE